MAIAQYLAMTAAEMQSVSPLPGSLAWMACHFSPYSTGLCNLPTALPPGSLLILNDRTPIRGHDPERVCRELDEALRGLRCTGLLADFQHPPTRESMELVRCLTQKLELPMAFPPEYAAESTVVFVPPVPTDIPIGEYLKRWKGRRIWLEAALSGQTIVLTPGGARYSADPFPPELPGRRDAALHCHYTIEEKENAALFRTWRTEEDLFALLEEAGRLGVALSVGLYQELGKPGDVPIRQ